MTTQNSHAQGQHDHADIAIVGMALKVPGAQSVAEYWRNLVAGTESVERLDAAALMAAGETPERIADPNYVAAAARLDGFDRFDAEFFGFGPREAAILDPQHRKFLEVAWEAMEQAGRVPAQAGGNVGVFAGCGMGSYFWVNICSNPDLVEDVGMFLLRHTGNDKDFLATRASHLFDLHGPSVNIQTACSTSLVAVHYACAALRAGQCDMALAGGSTIELPQGRGYVFKENEILSPDGHCHAFDHRAAGTVFGSGAGAVALRRLKDAQADGDPIWAVIRGTAVNNDGAAKAGYLAPSVDGQAAAVRAALDAAGVSPDSIGYVECHGTGTYLGDPIEVAALTQAFGEGTARRDVCRIGSVKTNIGHLDTAAGVAGLIKASLAVHHGKIPPSLNFEAPNPAIDFAAGPFRVCDRLTDWPAGDGPRRAGVNALGVGGTNAHAVLEEPPARAASEEPDWPFHILCLSGKSKAALDANARALAAHLRAHPDQPLADVAYTLKTGREGFEHRRVLVAESHSQAAALLEAGDPRRVFDHKRQGPAPDVVFMFPGGGAQYPGMARDLYETEPVFAEWMDRGLDHLASRLDEDIRALWLPQPGARVAAEAALLRPSAQLPLIMMVEYALAQLWLSWGIRPAALIGHSMGENTAAALAGVMGFEDCIDLVLLRGQLFDRVPPGGMLSVALPQAELEALIGTDLDIASVNAEGLCAVSGPAARLDRLAVDLAARDIECQRIAIDIAAHSRMLDPILGEFRDFLETLDLRAPEIPIVSNRSGDWLSAEKATDPAYWAGQLRHMVRFADGMARLAEQPGRVFFEVGPGRALSSLARMQPGIAPGQVLSALRHPDEAIADDRYLLETVGRFWALGVEADWAQVWGEARRNRQVLPTYAFQSSRYFIEPGRAQPHDAPDPARAGDIADWGWRPLWQPRLAACDSETLATLGADDPQRWLILADESGICDAVSARLSAAGHTVTTLRPGDSFARLSAAEYRLAPDQGAEGYDALMRALAADGRLPTRILHGWLVTEGESFRPGSDFFTRNIEHGFYSLMHLARALEGVARPDQVHITVLTSGAAQVADEPLPCPEKAMIAGPAGVIPRELPGLTVATLDIAPDPAPERRGLLTRLRRPAAPVAPTPPLAERLLEDLLAEPANSIAALRGARRYEQVWKPAPLPESHGDTGLRDGGTYLITGGLGGIGLSIARDLARRHRARLVLVTRTPLPARTQWQELLDTRPETDPAAQRIRALREIEALGGAVRIETADIRDIEQMRQAVARARADFGPIHGVIHAAGLIDDAPLLGKTVPEIERILAPKVHGLRVLDSLFPDGSLELMVLCSSTSTITRPEGQIDYVAANEYLNVFARARRGGATRVLAVDWGVWAGIGMAARAVAGAAGGPAAPDWTPADAPLIDAVARGADGGHRARLTLDAGRDWIVAEHRTADGMALLSGTGFVELALQSHLAAGGALPAELREMVFLRPLDVPDGAQREVQTRLTPDGAGGSRFEVRSAVRIDGRAGMVLNAQARLAPAPARPPAPLDITALERRCAAPSCHTGPDGFVSPQEAHLAFGPRWRVVRAARLGAGEGLAQLALPEAFRGDLDAGYILHPALLDLATGWAVELIAGYAPDRLWVPVSYEGLRVWRALPAEFVSWVRLRPESDGAAGVAGFDVVLATPTGEVIAEIEDFQMQRLPEATALGKLAAGAGDDVSFADDSAPARPATPTERQMRRMVALGIRPEEGAEALVRALARPEPQLAVSPLDPGALMRLAETRAPERGAQSFDRPELEADFAAPETETQTRLAALWEGFLGVSPIGIHDSFFDLGGHSLLAVRLFAAIKREMGVQFPISVLIEAPTIAALATRIGDSGGGGAETAAPADAAAPAPTLRHAVALNGAERAGQTPFFIVAGMFGNVLNLRHLALQMGERPVYGLQARGLIGSDTPHETIEEAAADYLAEMRVVQPRGPYLIGGFSGGGITAYEIAQRLRAAGEQVSLLAMLDTPLPMRPPLRTIDKALMKLHDLRRGGPAYLLTWARNRWAWERTKRAGTGAAQAPNEDGSFNNRRIEMAFRRAVARYTPGRWNGPLVLFRPPLDRHWQVTGGNHVSREREYVFDDNGWRRHIPALQVIEVPGDHDSMVLTPNVSVLAKHLRDLARAADHTPTHGSASATLTAAE